MFTDTQIDMLINQESISSEWPWSTNDERVIDRHIREIVAEVRQKLRVEDKTEFAHYCSGYASYVDCWLYRPDDEFRFEPGNNYHGLVVLFSRLSSFYVIGEGKKSWTETIGGTYGGTYLPEFGFVDDIHHEAVAGLVPPVTAILDDRGLTRLYQSDLDTILPLDVGVPTILADEVFRHFDALFYWED